MLIRCILFLVMLFVTTFPARADDGGIAFGGSPRLLSGHPSVTMESEVVRIAVGKETVKVDCQFVFVNHGPACTVRMGFPDQGRGSEDPDEEGPHNPPKGTFLSYTSFVDGSHAQTQLIRADKPGNFWHAKTVRFGANQTRRVRDLYTVVTGGQIGPQNGYYKQSYYILHTGSSWHGPIGRAEVIITFAPDASPAPLRLVSLTTVKGNEADKYDWRDAPPGTLLYRGPSRPTVSGRTLRFVRTNFSPGYLDDILLYFGYRRLNVR